MNFGINPFQELYVTDSADPKIFVNLFSGLHIPDSLPLFSPGNVVLKGTQGSGKSMLLTLLKPEIRLAYAAEKKKFPVPEKYNKFIGAGINLTKSGILDLGQRPVNSKFVEEDKYEFPLLFADFLNYWIVRDLMESVELIAGNPVVFGSLVNGSNLEDFARKLIGQHCWFGALEGCKTFNDVKNSIDSRIRDYRAFMNYSKVLPDAIRRTKSTIAEPIARTAEILKATGVIHGRTEVQIRIDQVERLTGSDTVRRDLGREYRRVVNKALSLRDSRISYNLGTRRHAWEDELRIYGSDDRLEILRDYRIVDLDSVLLRREDRTAWLFPTFAEDAFKKRIEYANISVAWSKDILADVFGARYNYRDAARDYARNTSADRLLSLDPDTPKMWREFLLKLYQVEPFEAFVAMAWAQQMGGGKSSRLQKAPPVQPLAPWSGQWWLKERIRQANTQIAAKSAQRLRWSGKDQIIGLSSGNISVFLSICHECWDVYQRSARTSKDLGDSPLEVGIDRQAQSVGVYNACDYWYQKITERPNGDDRKRFLDYLGQLFRDWLLGDSAMSYPGWNGFSVDENELRAAGSTKDFIYDLVDYGELIRMPHTPKTKNVGKRVKFYLSPILSPQYQIPETHVKEPYYADIAEVALWIAKSGVVIEGSVVAKPTEAKKSKSDNNQMDLFKS